LVAQSKDTGIVVVSLYPRHDLRVQRGASIRIAEAQSNCVLSISRGQVAIAKGTFEPQRVIAQNMPGLRLARVIQTASRLTACQRGISASFPSRTSSWRHHPRRLASSRWQNTTDLTRTANPQRKGGPVSIVTIPFDMLSASWHRMKDIRHTSTGMGAKRSLRGPSLIGLVAEFGLGPKLELLPDKDVPSCSEKLLFDKVAIEREYYRQLLLSGTYVY